MVTEFGTKLAVTILGQHVGDTLIILQQSDKSHITGFYVTNALINNDNGGGDGDDDDDDMVIIILIIIIITLGIFTTEGKKPKIIIITIGFSAFDNIGRI